MPLLYVRSSMRSYWDSTSWKKMNTRLFFNGFLLWPWRGKYTRTNWSTPFFGVLLCGERGWAITLLLFLGCPGCYFNSPPPSLQSPQGALNPIPSCRLNPGGVEAGSTRRNPAVRVPGQGSSYSLSRAMKHKRLPGRRERSRGTHHPETVWTVFFIRGWLNDRR